MTGEPSVFRPAGISYMRIPAPDPQRAADFYEVVFGNVIGVWQRGPR